MEWQWLGRWCWQLQQSGRRWHGVALGWTGSEKSSSAKWQGWAQVRSQQAAAPSSREKGVSRQIWGGKKGHSFHQYAIFKETLTCQKLHNHLHSEMRWLPWEEYSNWLLDMSITNKPTLLILIQNTAMLAHKAHSLCVFCGYLTGK